MHKRYAKADEDKAHRDQLKGLPPAVANRMQKLCAEFQAASNPKALIAHDADKLDLLVELKEQKDLGNPYAAHWIHYALKVPGHPLDRLVVRMVGLCPSTRAELQPMAFYNL